MSNEIRTQVLKQLMSFYNTDSKGTEDYIKLFTAILDTAPYFENMTKDEIESFLKNILFESKAKISASI